MPRVIVDPEWPTVLRRLRQERGISLRQLAPLVLSSRGHLHDLETGRRQPSMGTAQRLDEALDAEGQLAALVHPVPVVPDSDRLTYVAAHPERLDNPTIDALDELLAIQRRVEDSFGATAVVRLIRPHLHLVTALVRESRGELRPRILAMASGWAQFAGWLHAATDNPRSARRWYGRAGDWAAEAGDQDMIATVLSMRGHLAWRGRKATPVVELSAAARACPASTGVRALATQQEARGYALLGEASKVDRLLELAAELASADSAHRPSWIYFHDDGYLMMQRGLAHQLLGRDTSAAQLLADGLDRLPAEHRRAEWAGGYLVYLAEAYRRLGEPEQARKVLTEATTVARGTASASLSGRVSAAVRLLESPTGGRAPSRSHQR